MSLCYSSNNNFDVSFSKNGNVFKIVIVFTKLSWLDGNALSITCTILWLWMISLVPTNWVTISLRKFETWVVFVCTWSKVSFPTINYRVELRESYKFLSMFHTLLGSSTFAMHGNNSSLILMTSMAIALSWWSLKLNGVGFTSWAPSAPFAHCSLFLCRCPHQVPKFLLFQCKVNLHLPNFVIVWAFKLVHLYETHNVLCLLRFHNRSHYVRLLFTLSFTTNPKDLFTFFHTRSQLPILDGVIVSLKKNKSLSWKNALFSLTKLWYHVEKLDYT